MGTYDVIVIGVGAMGSAACHQLARRGQRVLGLEQHAIGHDRGSSHGETRIIRKAYFEHPDYIPLLHRAYELWRELEREAGRRLFERCGLLMVGAHDSPRMRGVRDVRRIHDLAIDDVPIGELGRGRFAAFRAGAELSALFEADAGFLHVETCVRTQAALARQRGATLLEHTPATGWNESASGVSVSTADGVHHAERLVIAGGAWAARLLPGLAPHLNVQRKVQLWFPASAPACRQDQGCPVFAFDLPQGFFYGFPSLDGRDMKIAVHTGQDATADPDALDRSLRPDDVTPVAQFVTAHLIGVDTVPSRHAVCMYTMSPDEHFIIDRAPQAERTYFAAGFSGHGFKFAPLVGSILADLVMDGATRELAEFLSLGRLVSIG